MRCIARNNHDARSNLLRLPRRSFVSPALGWTAQAVPGTAESVEGDVDDDDDDDEDYSTLDTSGGFFVDTIVAKGLPEGNGVPTEVPADV